MSLSLNERTFVKKAMLEGLRTDRRTLDAHRELHIEFGQDRGHVVVHLGHTKYNAFLGIPSYSAI
jgi:exosome complex RNA-binding protein Rrp42 (RNase PH superfamily)